MSQRKTARDTERFVQRHFRFGWWSLLLFLTLGIALETLHGLKIGWYLNVSNQTRRLLWTLSHAHGTLLALVHIAFAATLHVCSNRPWPRLPLASASLVAASVLLPGGFFLGGWFIYDGDPGLGVFLVPPGGLLLLVGVLLIARALRTTAADHGAAAPPSRRPRPTRSR